MDWNLFRILRIYLRSSRIFYRCVDWNLIISVLIWSAKVASFTDAWIETLLLESNITGSVRRIFYRCVDWNLERVRRCFRYRSRIFYRCVDWNFCTEKVTVQDGSRIFYRCVDWNSCWSLKTAASRCRIFYRCVDWNCLHDSASSQGIVASFTDAWIETQRVLRSASTFKSHLLQMRGLKLLIIPKSINRLLVASFTDAWIETLSRVWRVWL